MMMMIVLLLLLLLLMIMVMTMIMMIIMTTPTTTMLKMIVTKQLESQSHCISVIWCGEPAQLFFLQSGHRKHLRLVCWLKP